MVLERAYADRLAPMPLQRTLPGRGAGARRWPRSPTLATKARKHRRGSGRSTVRARRANLRQQETAHVAT